MSRPEIQQLFGVLTHKKVDEAFFVTTATFSSHAEGFASGKPIHLIDLDKLIAMAKRAFGETYVSPGSVSALSAQEVGRLTEDLANESISPVLRALRGSIVSLVALLVVSWFSFNLLLNPTFMWRDTRDTLGMFVGIIVGAVISGALVEKLERRLF